MAEPFTLATIAAGCVWGLIGNRADAAAMAGARKLVGVLARTQTPQNHDVLRATHSAWLKSLQVMARLANGATTVPDDHPSLKALKKAVRNPALAEFRFGGRNFPNAELERLVGDIYRADSDPDTVVVEAVISQVEAVMGQPLTEGLRTVFRTGHAGKLGWAQTFQLFFSQAVKDDEALFRILTFERLNEVIAFATAQAEALAGLERDLHRFRAEMHDRFDAVAATQDVHTALLNQILANQGRGEQASIELLRALARGYSEQHSADDLEGLQSYLYAKIDQWREYRARIEELEAEGNRDAALLADAKAATDRGDFGTADALLAEAVEALDEKVAPLLIAKSARIALRGENARMSGDYAAAMRFFDEAAAILPPQAREQQLSRFWRASSTQHEWGERFGDPSLLPDAVRRWRRLADLIPRANNPTDWAGVQNNLANSLVALGERENSAMRLREAVAAYRLALEEWTRARAPLDWAATQNNLGTVLKLLGEREVGTTTLVDAVAAFRLALEEWTRERVPLDWGMAQNNLGAALRTLGEREGGRARLEEAVEAYRLALEERTRERTPLGWANVQNNLGNALRKLGDREEGTARLEEAVTAYRSALEERTLERVPLNWAGTVLGLSLVLATIHERGGEQLDLAALRIEAEIARGVLIEGQHRSWTPFANHVIAEIDRIIAAQSH